MLANMVGVARAMTKFPAEREASCRQCASLHALPKPQEGSARPHRLSCDQKRGEERTEPVRRRGKALGDLADGTGEGFRVDHPRSAVPGHSVEGCERERGVGGGRSARSARGGRRAARTGPEVEEEDTSDACRVKRRRRLVLRLCECDVGTARRGEGRSGSRGSWRREGEGRRTR